MTLKQFLLVSYPDHPVPTLWEGSGETCLNVWALTSLECVLEFIRAAW